MSVSGTKSIGLITFDNINSRLPATLVIDANGSGGSSTVTSTVFSGITLANTTTTVEFRGSNGTLNYALGADNIFSTSAGSTLQFDSAIAISGAFNLTKTGSGSLNLNDANSFSGTFTASAGTTTLGINGALGGVSGVNVASGAILTTTLGLTGSIKSTAAVTLNGTLDLSSDIETIGSLAGTSATASLVTGKSSTTNGTLIVGNSTSTTFAGVISGSPVTAGTTIFTKQGTGTLTLTNANTYTGNTSITAGTLLINNTTGSGTGTGTVAVGSGGTLGGSGFVTGNTTVASGGTLAPGGTGGTSIGQFTLGTASTGATAINGTYAVNLTGSATPTAGTTYDQISVLGALTLSSTTSMLTVTTASANGLAVGQELFIALNDGTDLVTGTFSQGAAVTDSLGDTFTINYAANGDGGTLGNDISLTVLTVIPEPATCLGGALMFGAAGWNQRRRVRGWFAGRRSQAMA